MQSLFEIPLSAQAQLVSVNLINTPYQIGIQWNSQTNTWQLDLYDGNGNELIAGIPMVSNVDLLEQFAYLGISGSLVAQTDNDPDANPTYENLGTNGHLYFVTPAI